jgi:hypothetical protein
LKASNIYKSGIIEIKYLCAGLEADRIIAKIKIAANFQRTMQMQKTNNNNNNNNL